MAKTGFKSADEYIKTFPADKQAILKQVREAIKQSKGAVNFPLDEPVPVKLNGQMSKFQAADIAARLKGQAKVGDKSKTKTKTKTTAKAKTKVAKKKT